MAVRWVPACRCPWASSPQRFQDWQGRRLSLRRLLRTAGRLVPPVMGQARSVASLSGWAAARREAAWTAWPWRCSSETAPAGAATGPGDTPVPARRRRATGSPGLRCSSRSVPAPATSAAAARSAAGIWSGTGCRARGQGRRPRCSPSPTRGPPTSSATASCHRSSRLPLSLPLAGIPLLMASRWPIHPPVPAGSPRPHPQAVCPRTARRGDRRPP